MATNAIPGYGTLLKIGDGAAPENFSTVVEVFELKPPQIKLKTDDATSHDSNGWTEIIATVLEGGQVTAKINWRPSDPTHDNITGVLSKILNRTKANWKIILPGAVKTFSFAAILTDFKPDAPVEKKLVADITLQISGAITIS